MNTFTYIFLMALTISYTLQFWLSFRQKNYVLAHRGTVPDAFKDKVTLEEHQKAADYTTEKGTLSDLNSLFSIVLLLALTLGGMIDLVFKSWAELGFSPIVTGLGAMASIFIVMTLLELPSSYYQTFVIEEKYGFNNSKWQQFFKDQAISMSLVFVIGMPLLGLILWMMAFIGSTWWLWAWALLISFSLLMSWLFPTMIAPLFNKFTPMEEGTLKDRIQGLLQRCGFNSQGIFIMDGSKRSGHGNAYFTGLGKNKRIVFFDTLIESLEDEELEAVLAHELGHFKCKHVIKMLVATSITTLISFAILGELMSQQWFFNGLGVDYVAQYSNAVALLLFAFVSPVFTPFMQPISAYFQRKFEFEADDFAANNAKATKMISGLVKLYQENASTLTPDPLYSAFHYSHPPAAIRIAHLEASMTS